MTKVIVWGEGEGGNCPTKKRIFHQFPILSFAKRLPSVISFQISAMSWMITNITKAGVFLIKIINTSEGEGGYRFV